MLLYYQISCEKSDPKMYLYYSKVSCVFDVDSSESMRSLKCAVWLRFFLYNIKNKFQKANDLRHIGVGPSSKMAIENLISIIYEQINLGNVAEGEALNGVSDAAAKVATRIALLLGAAKPFILMALWLPRECINKLKYKINRTKFLCSFFSVYIHILLILFLILSPQSLSAQQNYATGIMKLDFYVNKKTYNVVKTTLVRENYNAHSYLINILSYQNNGILYVVPLLGTQTGLEDEYIDAPGSDCYRRFGLIKNIKNRTYFINFLNRNENTTSLVSIYEASINDEDFPGFPPLYFKKKMEKTINIACDPNKVNPEEILSDLMSETK